MFWCIGSVAVVDLRVMEVAVRKRNVAELADQLFPWAWIGFMLAIVSGFYMFATDAADWAPSPVFHVKLDADCSLGDCGTRRAARCAYVGPESGGTSGGEHYCPDLFIVYCFGS